MRVVPRFPAGALVLAACLVPAAASGSDFEAGFAVADITPPVGWRGAGNYTELISTGVRDPLLAKGMVLAQGDARFAFVGNDLCSVPRDLTDEARREASAATGIPVAHIVIAATHTHGGPEYCGPLRDVLRARAVREKGRDDREPVDYRARLVAAWVDVLTRADRARKGADLSVVVPQRPGLAFNRRYLMKDGSTGWIPGRLNPNILRPLGPTDPDVPFLLARDAGGRPTGGLAVFAMHTAIHGGPTFSACYPGHLQTALREQLKAPEFVSIFGEGCAGDVNHVDVSRAETRPADEIPRDVGRALAAAIGGALPHARKIKGGRLAVRSETVRIPIRPLSDAEYDAARKLMDELDRTKAPFLTTVDAWRKMFQREYQERHGGAPPQEVQAMRLDDDLALVALPHEVFVELGMAIKSGSPFRTTVVISLANDIDFYIPTRRAFEEGHYEPTTCPLVPGCGETLVATALKLLNELKP